MVEPVVRAALLARVSTDEQVEGYSLDAQRRAYRTLVDARGWSSYQEFIEEGRSAHTEDIGKRPVFKQAIATVVSVLSHTIKACQLSLVAAVSKTNPMAVAAFEVKVVPDKVTGIWLLSHSTSSLKPTKTAWSAIEVRSSLASTLIMPS